MWSVTEDLLVGLNFLNGNHTTYSARYFTAIEDYEKALQELHFNFLRVRVEHSHYLPTVRSDFKFKVCGSFDFRLRVNRQLIIDISTHGSSNLSIAPPYWFSRVPK